MAFTAVITKGEVTVGKEQDQLYSIPANVVIESDIPGDPSPYMEFGVSSRYNSNTTPERVKTELTKQIKKIWDDHVLAKTVEDSAALDSAIADLNTAMNSYINS